MRPAALVEPGVDRVLVLLVDQCPEHLTGDVVVVEAGELLGLRVRAAHHAQFVDRQHRLGEVVEQEAQLGLGVDEPVDRAVEVAGDPP